MSPLTSRRVRAAVSIAALTLVTAGCAEDKPLNTFDPRGPKAELIDNLMWPFIWGVMAVIFVLVVGGGIWVTIKNRVKPEDYDHDDLPEQVHGNTRLELGWTIAPAVLLAVISIPTVVAIWDLEAENEPDELDVMVIGQQWWWEYRYDTDGDGFFVDANGDGVVNEEDEEWPLNLSLDPDDLSVPNQMVIPAGEQIDLTLTSRDVIHSFWIPKLNGKRDTVPGRFATWSLEADEPGEFNGWCTEFCGVSHARMRMSVVALARPEFEEWLARQSELADVPTDEAAVRGYEIFQAQCMSCHVIDDGNLPYAPDFEAALTSGAAPNLTHYVSRSVFAGAIFSQYAGIDPDADTLDVSDYLNLSRDGRLNQAQIKRWVSNAPAQKDMEPDDGRGMPAFPNLTAENLDDIVAYLSTLD